MKRKTTTKSAAVLPPRPPLPPLPSGPGSTVRVPLERLAEWLAQAQAAGYRRGESQTGDDGLPILVLIRSGSDNALADEPD